MLKPKKWPYFQQYAQRDLRNLDAIHIMRQYNKEFILDEMGVLT
jgi:hypothetical protein